MERTRKRLAKFCCAFRSSTGWRGAKSDDLVDPKKEDAERFVFSALHFQRPVPLQVPEDLAEAPEAAPAAGKPAEVPEEVPEEEAPAA